MNIFFLDTDIEKSASFHVDKHVNKMRVELAQLASTAHWMTGSTAIYKKTHINHPSNLWTRESLSNYLYVVNLGLTLCEEMRYRFATKQQKTEMILIDLKQRLPNIPDIGMTLPRLAMNSEIEITPYDGGDMLEWAVKHYRKYYEKDKIHLFRWKNREIPNWINIESNDKEKI